MDNIHVIPVGDLREHESRADCWCKPKQDEIEESVYIHYAMDGREQYETGERKLN